VKQVRLSHGNFKNHLPGERPCLWPLHAEDLETRSIRGGKRSVEAMQVSDAIQTRLKATRARRRELELKLISNPDFREWVEACETIAELEKLELDGASRVPKSV
jgi:hypothetical protein